MSAVTRTTRKAEATVTTATAAAPIAATSTHSRASVVAMASNTIPNNAAATSIPRPLTTDLATAQARLLLLGESLRAAATADPALAIFSSSARAVASGARTTASSAATSISVSTLPTTADAGVPTSVAAPIVISATERLTALHDNLRRVQRFMKEYEELSQRAVELHFMPTRDEDTDRQTSEGINSGRKGKAHAPLPMPPSPDKRGSGAAAAAVIRASNASTATSTAAAAAAASSVLSGPSLHQRRALASDATFTRFCTLRVGPEELLLPWALQVAAPVPSALTDGIVESGTNNGKSGTTEEEESTASSRGSSTGSTHSNASASLRSGQRQRQEQADRAHLGAYAHYFLRPSVPLGGTGSTRKSFSVMEGVSTGASDGSDPVAGPRVVLRQLLDTKNQFDSLRRCRLYNYQGKLKADAAEAEVNTPNAKAPAIAAAASAAGCKDEPRWEHMPLLVEHMGDALKALWARLAKDSNFAGCGTPAVNLGRQLHAWTQPLLRQINELLSNPPLEEVDGDLREKLHRLRFDVEELQQAQGEAITNGDMRRSEELYYEQTSLAEAMKGPYDELEQLMAEYATECIANPLSAVQEQRDVLVQRLTKAIEEQTAKLTNVVQDVDRLKEKKRTVVQTRHRQRNAISAYHHNWRTQWQHNSDEQMECLRAVEQLERKLNGLQQTQGALVEDWIGQMSLERQREEDAAAFACFADARTQALLETQRNLQAAVDGLRQYSGAVHFGCGHVDAFARNVLQEHVTDAQLALRKDRLTQFRTFYLTFGDLRFKKSRNAEEIQKKIDYYNLQQEVAMDVMNPKAKEYSKAKKEWELAKGEVEKEIERLDYRSQRQLEGFRPTERLLRDAGVDFVSPEEELAQRTRQRTQRLLEYQQLIEEGMGMRPSESGSASGGPATTGHLLAPQARGSPLSPTLPTANTMTGSSARARNNARPSPTLVSPNTDSRSTPVPRTSNGTTTASSTAAAAAATVAAAQAVAFRGSKAKPSSASLASLDPGLPPLHSTEQRSCDDVSMASAAGGKRASGTASNGSSRRRAK